jgi:hypothetical protein
MAQLDQTMNQRNRRVGLALVATLAALYVITVVSVLILN